LLDDAVRWLHQQVRQIDLRVFPLEANQATHVERFCLFKVREEEKEEKRKGVRERGTGRRKKVSQRGVSVI